MTRARSPPARMRKAQQERFHPPLDIVDGVARIVEAILHGCNTTSTCEGGS